MQPSQQVPGTEPSLPPVGSGEVEGVAPVQPVGQLPIPPAMAGGPAAPTTPAAQPTQASPQQGITTPSVADDGDLIEKEWVSQVQQIVAATAHDPFEQSRQLTKLRADYMQKRYGKSIKSDD